MDGFKRPGNNDRWIHFSSDAEVQRREREYREQREVEEAKEEAFKAKLREAQALYWANITPEEREARRLKTIATRRANEQRRRERDLAERQEAERKEQARLKRKAKRELAFGPMVPDERRTVPGGTGLYDFEAIPQSYLYKRNKVFWLYVDQSAGPDACWPWHGDQFYDSLGRPTDYGMAYWQRGLTGAHRVAWMLNSGFFIPPGLVIDHMCGCKWCVQPCHALCTTPGYNTTLRTNRPPELTRERTSFDPPWDDRWYPFGRRKYDEAGNLKPEYREDAERRDEPPEPTTTPTPRRPLGAFVRHQLLDDDEEF